MIVPHSGRVLIVNPSAIVQFTKKRLGSDEDATWSSSTSTASPKGHRATVRGKTSGARRGQSRSARKKSPGTRVTGSLEGLFENTGCSGLPLVACPPSALGLDRHWWTSHQVAPYRAMLGSDLRAKADTRPLRTLAALSGLISNDTSRQNRSQRLGRPIVRVAGAAGAVRIPFSERFWGPFRAGLKRRKQVRRIRLQISSHRFGASFGKSPQPGRSLTDLRKTAQEFDRPQVGRIPEL